jgi:PAS domain S-box-containing protein
MDLILAHKRAMKLCELSGLSLLIQTSLATAVSEVARCAIEHARTASFILSVDSERGKKMLKAVISDTSDFSAKCYEAISYARRLVDDAEVIKQPKDFQVVLKQHVGFQGIFTDNKIQSFIDYFHSEPPISAYDEIRRKNIMLQDFAEKLRESDTDYRILTDSLPLMMFALNNRGMITYSNKWLKDFFGDIPQEFNSVSWQNLIHPNDFSSFSKEINNSFARQIPFNGQYRFREKNSKSYLWHMMTLIPLKNEKQIVNRWTGFVVDIDAQKAIEQALKDNKELQSTQKELYEHQAQLQQKVIELNRSNHELEQFAHLATHDLQEPLRKLFFYSDILKRKYGPSLDSAGLNVLNNMAGAASRMRELINDLLSYSRLQKQDAMFEEVKLNEIISDVIKDLDLSIREKSAVIEVSELPLITGNIMRLRQLFNNLISNSLKYSRSGVPPIVQITVSTGTPEIVISVRDNGIGFEEKHSEKIFGLFERLHTRDKFPGTGIGLSICRKIAELHGGRISATSVLNEYAQFDVTLPKNQHSTHA